MRRDVMIRVLSEMAVKGKRDNPKPEHEAVKQFLEGICLGDDANYLEYDIDKMEQHIINFLRALHYVVGNYQEANVQNVMTDPSVK